MGNISSAEKDKVEQEVIRADFVRLVLRLLSACRTQVALEAELGACKVLHTNSLQKETSSISSAML